VSTESSLPGTNRARWAGCWLIPTQTKSACLIRAFRSSTNFSTNATTPSSNARIVTPDASRDRGPAVRTHPLIEHGGARREVISLPAVMPVLAEQASA